MRLLLASALSATVLFGCGDGSQLTTVTVEVEADPQFIDLDPTTLEYTVWCLEESLSDFRSDPTTGQPQLVGEFEPGRPSALNGEARFVWDVSVDAPPGPCAVGLRLRDSAGEVICSHLEEFVVAADAPTEVEVLLGCEVF